MLFSSFTFISVFLPITLVLYFLFKNITYKNVLLLLASLLFYSWGEPTYIFLMLASILVNYLLAILIDTTEDKIKIFSLILAVFINILILSYYKYTNFLIEYINLFFHTNIHKQNISLPIGISFFTFQSMSYIIDVFSKQVQVQKNIYKIALYISFFPQLIAGPIVRYIDVEKAIDYRKHKLYDIEYGIKRFCIGLGKKVIIANILGEVVDKIFNSNLEDFGRTTAWIGILFYSFQLYFDFSGYSDMAIGLGRIFGFKFLENFNLPYISKSISEFWRRWHISLGVWFKDYLYIPLGGSKKHLRRNLFNLLFVFFITGLWHGANNVFIMWGLIHGITIAIERLLKLNKYNNKIINFFKHLYTLFIIVIGWVFFRSPNVGYALEYLKKMFSHPHHSFSSAYYFNNLSIIIFIIAIIVSVIKLSENNLNKIPFIIPLCLLVISMLLLANNSYNPFIYFKF